MKCPTCGIENTTDARFCGECGVPLSRDHQDIEVQMSYSPVGMIGFSDAIRLAFSRYADFENRSSRAEYWWWFLFTNMTGFVAGFVDSLLGTGALFAGYGVAGGIFYLVVIVPSLSLGARRLHDVNRTGWWQLLFLIPLVGWIILFYWAITPSNSGHNRFGYYPLSSTYKR